MVFLQRSLFFIKEEAEEHKKEIEALIQKENRLRILVVKLIEMNATILFGTYAHVSKEVMLKLIERMLSNRYLVGVVEGENAVEVLVEIAGRHTAPSKCDPSSIRFIFGNHEPGFEHHNAIHRPTSKTEADANLWLFGFGDYVIPDKPAL